MCSGCSASSKTSPRSRFSGEPLSSRPLEVSHLGAERRRYPLLPSHRLRAKSPDSQLAVGRSEGLRRQIPHLQQRRGFPPPRKFTYNRLSEDERRVK